MITRRLLLAGAAAGLAATAVSSPAFSQGAPRELRIGLITPDSHSWNQQLAKFAEELKAQSGGRLSLVVFPAAQLGNEAAMIQQLQTGALDMAWITIPEMANHSAGFASLLAPFLVKDITQAAAILRHEKTNAILETLPDVGLVGLGYGMTGLRQIYTRKPVNSVADLAGMKIRILPAAPYKDFYGLVGAAPTPVSFTEVYDALANGQIDAIDMDFEGTTVYKLYDHLSQLLMTNHFMFGCAAVASARVWSGMDAADRELVSTLMAKHLDTLKDSIVANEAKFLAQLKETKLDIRPIDATFFGDIPAKWDAEWSKKTPMVAEMRALAASL